MYVAAIAKHLVIKAGDLVPLLFLINVIFFSHVYYSIINVQANWFSSLFYSFTLTLLKLQPWTNKKIK